MFTRFGPVPPPKKMVSLRRQKLKAKRAGCNSKKVDECKSVVEVLKLMGQLEKKNIEEDNNGPSE